MKPKTFHDLGVVEPLADALSKLGITTPFPVQELALPVALQGADVIAQARTGTGKTLGFGLPLLQRIDTGQAATQALVVVPTRELCLQVAEDLVLGQAIDARVVAVYGGVAYDTQIAALTSGVHVVVGTPGRLLDHLQKGNLDLSQVAELVLDEADEMLDMGFLPDVERLIQACPQQRHTMLFSATMPTPVVKLARRYMDHPTFLRADTQEHEVAPTVEQHFFHVHRLDKPRVLARLLQVPERGSCYVFVRTKNMVDRLVAELEGLGVDSIAVHGDLRQATRERNMERFRAGHVDVLVATEVAARGLDVDNVTHVVNYDCPDDEKMYLHRIGRTARAGGEGVAITFAEFNEVDRLNVIRKAVDADREIEEVFSTSDLLAERFDLPDRTPWGHLGNRRPARSSGRRASSTDGKPKNRAPSERSGSPPARAPAAQPPRAPSRPAERDDRARKVRVRTRDAEASEAPGRPAAASEKPPREEPPADQAPTEPRLATSEGTRSRRRRGPRRSEPAPPAETRRQDAKRSVASRQEPDQSEDAPSRTPPAAAAQDSPSPGDPRGNADRDGSAGDASAGGGDDGAPRGGAAEQRRSKRGRGASSRRSPRRDPERTGLAGPGEDPTAAGVPARGSGRPQRARRVKVEHLP